MESILLNHHWATPVLTYTYFQGNAACCAALNVSFIVISAVVGLYEATVKTV
jgi:hypothetical protein